MKLAGFVAIVLSIAGVIFWFSYLLAQGITETLELWR
jgi:hypothetical protein